LGASLGLLQLRAAGRGRRAAWGALALAVISLNLFTVNWRYNLSEPVAAGPFPETGLVTFLRDQPGTFRISSAGLLPGGPSAGAVYEIEDITANTPFRLDAFQRFEDEVGSWQRWRLLNVRFVLSQRDLDGPGLTRVYEEDPVKVFRVEDPLPRAWIVHRAVHASDDEALTLIDSGELDLRTTAVLTRVDPLPGLQQERGSGSTARVIHSAPGRLVLEVSPTADGLLVISQPFYPGWQARVDGARAPIHRTNFLLQGVPIQEGTQQVELAYHLPLWPALISLLLLGACIASMALRRR
jgi:hypothetical protein